MIQRITLHFFLTLCIALFATTSSSAQSCNCWQTRDTSFHAVPFAGYLPPYYRNDDASTNAISLPFTFCFWGTPENSVFINTNGNITFGSGYAAFTPSGFPTNGVQMISAFWADVDLLDKANWHYIGTDAVFYKITPTYMVIQWDSVGYVGPNWSLCGGSGNYGNDSINNTFQIIISNGNDPIIPNHNNVEFCYKGMNWTTGADSPGPCTDNGDGFQGAPATVGANEGDGIRYVQIGRFASPNAVYAGQYPPGPNYDGVYWLDNKSFEFNLCSGQIAPLTSGVTPCDTFKICQGDSTNILLYYFTPIQGDSVWAKLVPPVMPGLTILSNAPGNTDSLVLKVVGSNLNYGYHTINLYGYDNQNPSDTSFTYFVVEVDSAPRAHLNSIHDTICSGDSATLSASGVQNYQWSTGSTNSSIKVSPPATQTYTLQLSNGKCVKDTTVNVVVVPKPVLSIVAKPDTICPKDSALLIASGGGKYVWNTGQTRDSIWVKPHNDSTYSVVVTNQCFTDTVKEKVYATKVGKITVLVSKDSICAGDSTTLIASGGGAYVWTNNSSTSSSITVKPSGNTTYSLVTTFNGKCAVDTTINIAVTPYPVVNVIGGTVCPGQCILLTASSSGNGNSFSWSNGSKTDTTTVCPLTTTTYVVDVSLHKCVTQKSGTITVNNAGKLYVCCNQTIVYGGTVTLNADSAISYVWFPSLGLSCDICATVIATPSVTTTYTVIGKNSDGCSAEREITVIVGCSDFIVPNVFTPNNDGINDDFVIPAQQMTAYSIMVYDRWGKVVYKSDNPLVYWNGLDANGQLVSDGTYYYVIKAQCGNGTSFNKKGFVQVLR